MTQQLWETVVGENPSRFKSSRRPVENVSWDDGREFFGKLSRLVPRLAPRYPTEAEWEYACRAGTTTSTYAGELEIVGENNGPILDDIAWYGGNSGVDFDLEDGTDSSDWDEKQHDHRRAGTRTVREKAPNAWGLFDMLGNVDEWCEDYWSADLGRDAVIDPSGLMRAASVSPAGARGSRPLATCERRPATGGSPAPATTASAFASPEVLRSGGRGRSPQGNK